MTPEMTLAEILFIGNVFHDGLLRHPCRLLMNLNIWITWSGR